MSQEWTPEPFIDYFLENANDTFSEMFDCAWPKFKTGSSDFSDLTSAWGEDLFSSDKRNRLNNSFIASIAALAVCADLKNEFKAIKQTGMADHITLRKAVWNDNNVRLSILDDNPRDVSLKYGEGLENLDIDLEQKMAIETLFDQLYGHLEPPPQNIQFSNLKNYDKNKKILIIKPENLPERFCKVGSYSELAKEYHGYINYACQHIDSSFLLGEIRLAKYRTEGALSGSLIKNSKSLASILKENFEGLNALITTTSKILVSSVHPSQPGFSFCNLYAEAIDEIENRLNLESEPVFFSNTFDTEDFVKKKKAEEFENRLPILWGFFSRKGRQLQS